MSPLITCDPWPSIALGFLFHCSELHLPILDAVNDCSALLHILWYFDVGSILGYNLKHPSILGYILKHPSILGYILKHPSILGYILPPCRFVSNSEV